MRRLVLTADDFGLTDGVCAGIVCIRRHGSLLRASSMECVPGSLERVSGLSISSGQSARICN
jgi:predicted glycoside hydrolase/deacetylase ChbG (UPF0249 family)